MRTLKVLAIILSFAVLLTSIAKADLVNGDFEVADPNSEVITGWTTEYYAKVHTSFYPDPDRGRIDNWSIDENGLLPQNGQQFLLLSTGDLGSDNETSKGTAHQTFTAQPGETLLGWFFFGTCDYMGWNDRATIKLTIPDPNEPREPIKLVWAHIDTPPDGTVLGEDRTTILADGTILASDGETVIGTDGDHYAQFQGVYDVTDYGSTDGWLPFSYTFTEETAGTYVFEAGVFDIGDQIYKSYLAIDNLRLCQLPPAGDLNGDCVVNTVDLGFFSNSLGLDCSDPNNLCDYINMNGQNISLDSNENGVIDPEDAWPIMQHWLWKPEE